MYNSVRLFISFLIIWFFSKPYVMDFFLNNYISSNLDDSFTGDPSMLIDTVKATNPNKVFPGTNPLIVESAQYYRQLYLSSDSYVFISKTPLPSAALFEEA